MSKKQNSVPQCTGQIYSQRPNTQLPENHGIREGFLCKSDMPVTLVTSGVIEAASQGFLHVEDAQEYETR